MAASSPDRPAPHAADARTRCRAHLRAAALGAALAAAALAPPVAPRAAGPQLQPDRPITLDARSSNFDYRSGRLVFDRVRIAQGPLSVEADSATATGLEFEESQWSFRGNVRITVEGGALASDAADVAFVKNELSSATITGEPATFEQRREDGVARGRANRIEYRFAEGTVRMSGGAWLSDGTNEINGRTLVYNMVEQRVLATAAEQGDDRVRITINPKGAGTSKPAPAPAPTPPAPTPPRP